MKKIGVLFFVLLCIAPMVFAASEDDLFNQGVSLLKQEKPQEAVQAFSKLIQILPDSPDAYRNRGVGYMKLNRYDEAISDFQKAMELKPDLKDLYSNMGVALYYKKEYRKAIEFYDKELTLRPDNHFCLFNRAICWAALKEYEKGLKDVEKSLALFPDHYLGLCLKGDLLVKTGYPGLAAGAYKKALGLNPDHDYARRRLAELKSADTTAVKGKSKVERQTKTTAMPSTQGVYELQVGAFLAKENAQKTVTRIKEKGYPAKILELTGNKGRQWYLVRIGTYDSAAAANNDKEKVNAELEANAVVRRQGRF